MFQDRTQAQSPSPHTGAVTSSCMNAVNTCNPVRTANANTPFLHLTDQLGQRQAHRFRHGALIPVDVLV